MQRVSTGEAGAETGNSGRPAHFPRSIKLPKPKTGRRAKHPANGKVTVGGWDCERGLGNQASVLVTAKLQDPRQAQPLAQFATPAPHRGGDNDSAALVTCDCLVSRVLSFTRYFVCYYPQPRHLVLHTAGRGLLLISSPEKGKCF